MGARNSVSPAPVARVNNLDDLDDDVSLWLKVQAISFRNLCVSNYSIAMLSGITAITFFLVVKFHPDNSYKGKATFACASLLYFYCACFFCALQESYSCYCQTLKFSRERLSEACRKNILLYHELLFLSWKSSCSCKISKKACCNCFYQLLSFVPVIGPCILKRIFGVTLPRPTKDVTIDDANLSHEISACLATKATIHMKLLKDYIICQLVCVLIFGASSILTCMWYEESRPYCLFASVSFGIAVLSGASLVYLFIESLSCYKQCTIYANMAENIRSCYGFMSFLAFFCNNLPRLPKKTRREQGRNLVDV